MKLKDKFHSPKIKRTPSKKGKQLQPEPTAKSTEKPANKVCVLCVYIQYIYTKTYLCVLWEVHFFFASLILREQLFGRGLFSCSMCCALRPPLCLCVHGFFCWFPQLPSHYSSWLCYSRCLNLCRRELSFLNDFLHALLRILV